MQYYPGYNKLSIAKEFAKKVFNYWGIGDSYCNNGILIFLSIEDRVGFVATGSGAQSRLTNSRASSIITSTMRPYLQRYQFDDALVASLYQIDYYLKGSVPWNPLYFIVFIFLVFFGIIAGAVMVDAKKERKYKTMKSSVQKLENDRDALNKNTFNVDICPICLNELNFDEEREQDAEPKKEEFFRKYWRLFKKQMNKIYKYLKQKYEELTSKNKRTNTANDPSFDEFFRRAQELDKNTVDYSRKAFALRCNHIFCEKCIKPWLERQDSCPVCKLKVVEDEQEGVMNLRAAERVNTRREANLRARNINDELRWQTIEFRTHRLHSYYPRYVTRPMLDQFVTMPTEAYLTRHKHWKLTQRRRIERKARARNSARRSTGRSSFGGGRSSGGGGGSW